MYVLEFNETTTDAAIIPRVPSYKISSTLLRVTRTMSQEFVEYLWDKRKSLEGKGEIVRFLFCPLQWVRREASNGINETGSYSKISLLDTK